MNANLQMLLFATTLMTVSSGAFAISASELELIPSSAQCRDEAMSLGPLFERRDGGMSRDEAIAIVDKSRGVPISKRAVQIAFDFPKMPRDGLTLYTLWSCHATEHKVAIRPLSEVAAEFEECYSKPASNRQPCANVLWNKLHGFPDDHRSGAKPVLVMPAPVAMETRIESAEAICPTRANPAFPRQALFADISGTVEVTMKVSDGRVSEVLSMSGPEIFHASVRAALDKYKCRPLSGSVVARQRFTFKVETVSPAASQGT